MYPEMIRIEAFWCPPSNDLANLMRLYIILFCTQRRIPWHFIWNHTLQHWPYLITPLPIHHFNSYSCHYPSSIYNSDALEIFFEPQNIRSLDKYDLEQMKTQCQQPDGPFLFRIARALIFVIDRLTCNENSLCQTLLKNLGKNKSRSTAANIDFICCQIDVQTVRSGPFPSTLLSGWLHTGQLEDMWKYIYWKAFFYPNKSFTELKS